MAGDLSNADSGPLGLSLSAFRSEPHPVATRPEKIKPIIRLGGKPWLDQWRITIVTIPPLNTEEALSMKLKKASVSKTALFVRIILSLAFVFAFAHQSFADRWVDDDGTVGASSCDGATACGSIQAEINAASSETVWACPGTYTECITMKNGVHLKSTGGTPTINCDTDTESTVAFDGAITCDLDGFDRGCNGQSAETRFAQRSTKR